MSTHSDSDTATFDTEFRSGSEEGTKQTQKIWSIHDNSYSYAPSKPEGDPWDKVLAPLMKKDQMKCNAWKEEVQNLLIFAGLFSAVVTAFITESYKLLQPPSPPDSTMVLMHMLSDQMGIPSGKHTTSEFSPTSSAKRINIFWFISLMLSLATVLVGITSMQWLRQYQSYPNLSSRETLALFNMRSEAFKTWHVERIFAALPLLLQAALVLFFGGIIDFLCQLHRDVAISVTVVIVMTLLFLVATTVLPTMQCLALYVLAKTLGHHTKPSQCPYKSPQSCIFHSLNNFISFIFSSLFGQIFERLLYLAHWEPQGPGRNHVLPYLQAAIGKKTWIDFDLAWLSIRDACVHGSKAFDPCPGLDKCRAILDSSLPLYDITQVLHDAIVEHAGSRQSNAWLSVVYYCYQDIATSFLKNDIFNHTGYSDDVFDNIQRCYRYLSQLLNIEDPGYHLSIRYDKSQYANNMSSVAASAQATLYSRSLYGFLAYSRHYFVASNLSNHMLEIKMRMMKTFYGPHSENDYHVRPTEIPLRLPTGLKLCPYEMRKLCDKNQFYAFYWQYYHVLSDYFKYVAYSRRPLEPLHSHSDIADFLENASQLTYFVCSSNSGLPIASHSSRELLNLYGDILLFIAKVFREDLDGMNPAGKDTETLQTVVGGSYDCDDPSAFQPGYIDLFYTSAIYVQHFLSINRDRMRIKSIESNLKVLLQEMTRYRTRLLVIGSLPNRRLEDQFKRQPWENEIPRFTNQWWSFLDNTVWPTDSTPLDSAPKVRPIVQRFISIGLPNHPESASSYSQPR